MCIRDRAEGIGRVLIAIICLFVLVGLIFVLVTSYRLSKPLGEALAALSGGTKASGAPQRNQFSALKHSAAQMAGQNCALRESLEQQNALLKGIYFERLLQGKLATEEAQRRAGTLLSFPPDGKYFCAGLIAPVSYTHLRRRMLPLPWVMSASTARSPVSAGASFSSTNTLRSGQSFDAMR